MFSPGTKKKSNIPSRKQQSPPVSYGSPVTPAPENRKLVADNVVPDRPSTGTPAPWASSRLSVLARIPTTKKSDKGDDVDPIQPKRLSGDTCIYGGMDKGTSLAWIICGNRLFIWSYLSSSASRKCIVLELPSSILEDGDVNKNSGSAWLLCVLDWDHVTLGTNTVIQQRTSAGVLLCNRKTQAFVYWPNIYSSSPAVTYTDQPEYTTTSNKQQQRSSYNSLIVSAIPDKQNVCIAIACSSNGQLYRFICSPSGIQCRENTNVSSQGSQLSGQKGYPRSLIWHAPNHSVKESKRRFLLLTDHEIQCFSVDLFPDFSMSKLWSHEIVGNDGDVGIQKGL
nr:nuclear pore complex protein NUP133 [Tanacetum cinerariifolium]